MQLISWFIVLPQHNWPRLLEWCGQQSLPSKGHLAIKDKIFGPSGVRYRGLHCICHWASACSVVSQTWQSSQVLVSHVRPSFEWEGLVCETSKVLPRPQAPSYAGEGPGIHMRQIIRKFYRKIFWILVPTRGKIYRIAKRSKYMAHTFVLWKSPKLTAFWVEHSPASPW